MEEKFKIPAHLLSEIRNGHCVAFLGAGFSAAAGLPSWGNLLRNAIKLAKKAELFTPHQFKHLVPYLDDLIDNGSAENYDMVAQILEDELGKLQVAELISDSLKTPDPIPSQMLERLRLLKGIPFKAVLTTNFDLLLRGDTPGSDPSYDTVLRSRFEGSRFKFSKAGFEILGADPKTKDLNASTGGDKPVPVEDIPVSDLDATGSLPSDEKMPWPVIKIHGCISNPSSMVWTRTGYRELINEVPGYMHFLRTLLATSTVLYIGFSFSDGYLNEVRGEVLSMLYGGCGDRERPPAFTSSVPRNLNAAEKRTTRRVDSVGGINQHGRCLTTPMGYAIVHDKKQQDVDFFLMHEGVQIITWNSRAADGTRDYAGMDKYLRNLYMLTSSQYYLGKLAWGHRILMLVQTRHAPPTTTATTTSSSTATGDATTATTGSGGSEPPSESSEPAVSSEGVGVRSVQIVQEARRLRMSDLPGLLYASIENYENMRNLVNNSGADDTRSRSSSCDTNMGTTVVGIDELRERFPALDERSQDYPDGGALHVVKDDVNALLECMRLAKYDIVVTVYGWRSDTEFTAQDLVQGMRALPMEHQAPLMVTTREEGLKLKRRQCMKLGASDVVTNFDGLVNAVTNLLRKMKDSEKVL
mmetsp:Transcript_19595/g.32753  ORF Transcript_19595/g.32753 Transcript_19595/m.32753 type:complete len:640 (-) Transcript_19595:98-2017(-)